MFALSSWGIGGLASVVQPFVMSVSHRWRLRSERASPSPGAGRTTLAAMGDLRITVWNEWRHERRDPAVAALYPDGIHGAIASALREHSPDGVVVRCATLEEPGHGL